ncbi:hypothetical protein [Zobellia nedashkovskayae]|uniref:hypothetical protein n=1 Tax=Zobellia nedashkovskayae TaxID=2779510 RepID=UPI00293BEB13|nr:hypothetical protein [Zobellia nedashkovskayae]
MKITTSTLNDIPEIFRLYKLATDFQKVKFPDNQWPEFEKDSITTEVVENRQFKLLIDDNIACVWAITYGDP